MQLTQRVAPSRFAIDEHLVTCVAKAVVPCQNKIILKNFSINIHEAVLQPIAAFVYCNPRQQQTVAGT